MKKKGCDYCNARLPLYDDQGAHGYITEDGRLLLIDRNMRNAKLRKNVYLDCKINFCLMCGREFETVEGDSGDDLVTRVAELERLIGYHSERVTGLEEVVADLTRRVERLE